MYNGLRKGDNFHDFLFASMNDEAFSVRLWWKDRIADKLKKSPVCCKPACSSFRPLRHPDIYEKLQF